jgi:murein L,D-transpeptidase YafK
LWAELENGHLNVLERVGREGLVLRKRIPMSIGKQGIGKRLEGDKKTPVGVYRLTSRLDEARLDNFYGMGAFR